MGYSLRYGTVADFPAVAELDGASFGFHYSAQDLDEARLDVDPDRILLAFEGDRIVGVSAEMPFTMTMPGGGPVGVVGLTWVSVEITHRRRGILDQLMTQQLATARDNGISALILTASEGWIYRRYGFGVATSAAHTIVERARTRLLAPVPEPGVRRITTDQARDVLPGLYDRWRRQTPGALDRSPARWQMQLPERDDGGAGTSGLFHLVHPDGYVSYRIRSDGNPGRVCLLGDHAITTSEAHASLWQVLFELSLCTTIESHRVAPDDPLRYLLVDPRQVRTVGVADGLWLRPIDLGTLLSGRTYAAEIDVVLRVRDQHLGDSSVRLRGGPDGAACTPADAAPDLELGVAELGAISLGGTRLATLARAGLVRCDDPRTLTRLDRAFLTDAAPQYGTAF